MRFPIPLTDLASGDARRLRKRYRVRDELAQTIATADIQRRTDLLDNEAVCRNASPAELRELMRNSRLIPDEVAAEPPIVDTHSCQQSGLALVVCTFADERRRVAIRDGAGEIISAEVANALPGLRISTTHLLGYNMSELTTLSDAERLEGTHRLGQIRNGVAERLWDLAELTTPDTVEPRVFRALSAVLSVILWRTRPWVETSGPANDRNAKTAYRTRKSGLGGEDAKGAESDDYGCGPGSGWLADLIPELSFHQCCVGHDKCYETGGDALDKEKCDYKFYGCMLGTKWYAVPLASLYFWAVNTFGQESFHYHGSSKAEVVGRSIAGAVAVVAGIAAGLAAGSVLVGIGVLIGAAIVINLINLGLAALCRVSGKMECVVWGEQKRRESREERVKEIREHEETYRKRVKECSSWGWFSWLCTAFHWVWKTIKKIVTEVVWITKTVWYWVTETVCLILKLVFVVVGCGVGKVI